MAPATRAKAKAKLETLYVGIGYPEHWRDYSGLKIEPDDALGNPRAVGALRLPRERSRKLGKPVDKTEWAMTPQTVNAVNLPLQNALNFPAAILNPPFFDAAGDPVQNYGAHRHGHRPRDQPQLRRPGQPVRRGRAGWRNWWTPEDLAHFQAAAAQLVAQYDAYEPLPGLHVNGKLTLSENIADVAGRLGRLRRVPRAPTRRRRRRRRRIQRGPALLLAFGQVWRSKARPEAMRNQLMTDGHSPGPFRADTVRNLDPWYAAFDVRPGQSLYLEPAGRVRVW